MTKLLQSARTRNGFAISLRVAAQGSPEVWFDGRNLSNSTAFEFAARTNSLGDTAWANVFAASPKASLSSNEVVLNSRVVARNIAVQDVALTDTHLVWISPTANGTTITYFNLLTEEITNQTINFAADRLRAVGDRFVLVGLETVSGNAFSAIADPYQAPAVTNHGNRAMQLGGAGLSPMIVEISGNAAAAALFNAMMLVSEYSEEALAIATDDTGRVTNMFVQRLEAVVALAVATGDPELRARAAQAALDAVRQADANGVYYSTRYSIGDTPMAWSMHAALINGTALGATGWMTAAERTEVIAVAKAAYDYFESDWVNGAYVITPHSGVDFDGVIQPNNMQAVMGSFAIQLFEATGETRYLDRANAVFALLAQELIPYNGTNVFHYWPQAFRDGWTEGTFDSTSRPSYPASSPTLFDDVYHADLVISFFEDIARIRNEVPLVDATALFNLVQVNAYEFYGYFNGGPTGLEWLPSWASATQFQNLASRPFPTTLPVYDEGVHIAALAQAAKTLLSGGSGPLTVTVTDPLTGAVIETVTLTSSAAIVDWVQSAQSAYATQDAPAGIVFGTDASETLTGTPTADVIRGLGGHDNISLGDGADSGFGDAGDDVINGGAGADTLGGGDGNDQLNGGSGQDRLYGQNGDDSLNGQEDDDLLGGGNGNDVLRGGDGADQLYGGIGDDQLFGDGGTDRIYGGDGADRLDAGGGVAGEFQYLFGEGGDDSYVYATASGLVYLGSTAENAASGAADRVIFTDLNVADITLGYQDYRAAYPTEGLALMIQWNRGGQSGQLQIANGGAHIESYQFADGVRFDTLQGAPLAGGTYVTARPGVSADLIIGGAATDRIYGGDGGDRLDAGGGVAGEFQYLFGEGGDDSYVYATASGLVYLGSTAENAASGAADRVIFTDLNVADITLGYQDYRAAYPTEGLALMIQWNRGGQSGQLQIANGGAHIESYQFADGTTLTVQQLIARAGGSSLQTPARVAARETARLEIGFLRDTSFDTDAVTLAIMVQAMSQFGASAGGPLQPGGIQPQPVYDLFAG